MLGFESGGGVLHNLPHDYEVCRGGFSPGSPKKRGYHSFLIRWVQLNLFHNNFHPLYLRFWFFDVLLDLPYLH